MVFNKKSSSTCMRYVSYFIICCTVFWIFNGFCLLVLTVSSLKSGNKESKIPGQLTLTTADRK